MNLTLYGKMLDEYRVGKLINAGKTQYVGFIAFFSSHAWLNLLRGILNSDLNFQRF